MATPALTTVQDYEFEGGFPTPETVQRAYDDADLMRAISAYRFFYPTVSIMATWKGNLESGMVPNRVFGMIWRAPRSSWCSRRTRTRPTPAWCSMSGRADGGGAAAGPLMGTANDLNQRWVIDMGLPGPDGGQGGKHCSSAGYGVRYRRGYYPATPTTQPDARAVAGVAPHGD